MIQPADILNELLLPRWPEPDDLFDRARWCAELEHAHHELALRFNEQFNETVSLITAENLTSPVYELRFPTLPVRRVNTARLRTEMPAVFDRIVYVRASDAERILSRRRLYELCCQTDPDRTVHLAVANLGDLEKILAPGEQEPFVTIDHKPLRPEILEKEAGA